MAISTNYAFSVAVKQMQDVQAKITKTQSQLATGEMTANASDNPDATASIQRLQTAITRQASYAKSLTQADSRLATQETSISGASDALIRIKELSIQASNDTLSPQDRSNISIEIRSLRDQLLSLANARDESGNYVFGGARTGSQPFAADASGRISYAGDQSQVSVAIGEQRQIAVGGVGSQIFSTVVRSVDGVAAGVSFFQSLDDLSRAVKSVTLQLFNAALVRSIPCKKVFQPVLRKLVRHGTVLTSKRPSSMPLICGCRQRCPASRTPITPSPPLICKNRCWLCRPRKRLLRRLQRCLCLTT